MRKRKVLLNFAAERNEEEPIKLTTMGIIKDTYVCKSTALANYILAYANQNKVGINMTKLQKLMYITYGMYLAVKEERLTNEHPQAWPYGPVFPSARKTLLHTSLENVTDYDTNAITDDIKACVKLVFDSFGQYNASFLSAWSHKENSPWDRTVNAKAFRWGEIIPDEYILPYFKNLLIIKNG